MFFRCFLINARWNIQTIFQKKKKYICIYPFPPLSQYVPPTMKMFIALLLNFSGSIGVFGLFNDLSSHQRMDVAGLIFLREKVIDIKGPPNWVIKTIKINIHAKVIFRLWWWREIMMNGEIIGCFDVWSFWRGVALGFLFFFYCVTDSEVSIMILWSICYCAEHE